MGYSNRLGIFGFPAGIALMVMALTNRADLMRSAALALGGLFVIYLSLFIMLRPGRPAQP